MSVYHYDNARVARRLIGFVFVVFGVVLMTTLYYVKISAQSAKSEMRRLEAQIAKEELALNVLRAELAYLQNPDRLRMLSAETLGLQPTSVEQIAKESDIAILFAKSPPASSGISVENSVGVRP